jgi:hypothetical protein
MKTTDRLTSLLQTFTIFDEELEKKLNDASVQFDKLVKAGLVKKRGNQLSSITEKAKENLKFNNYNK